MRESVLDRAGTLFARHFCDAIARRESVAVALQEARQAITTPLADSPRLAGAGSALAASSLGQWCLPMLVAREPERPLIDWDFTPPAPVYATLNQTLNTVQLPPRFIGRRAELRELQGRLRNGHLRRLLITGPGGQGKTALAGRLAQELQARGHQLFAWSARGEHEWSTFELELELALNQENAERYSRMAARYPTEAERATLLLRLLLHQSGNRVALFFDNLETLQEAATGRLSDARIESWVKAAQTLTGHGLTLLLTSRWLLPGWPEADHWPLAHAGYGDFLQMARRQLPLALLRRRDWLRRVYRTLHGNGRGLVFFAGSIPWMDPQSETDFLARLEQATVETQTDMALEQIVTHLEASARTLLHRLPAYQTPVPLEGVLKLALDLPAPEQLLQRLLPVSLVEPAHAYDLQAVEYEISPLVAGWLAKSGVPAPDQPLMQEAAAYQLYLFRYERSTLSQAVRPLGVAHAALAAAGDTEGAHRLALDWIVGRLSLQGLYQPLLGDWLPAICQSSDPQTRGEALGQTGKQHIHLGNYDAALTYLEQSLKISREIGDKAGEGTTLNNISQIFKARGDYETALTYLEQSLKISREIGDVAGMCATIFNLGHIYWQNDAQADALGAWVTVYRLAKPIQLAQVLAALANLAGQLGLPGGLGGAGAADGGWDKDGLREQRNSNSGSTGFRGNGTCGVRTGRVPVGRELRTSR